MVKAAQKYGARCEVRLASKEVRDAMPVWYHIGAEPGRSSAKTAAAKCLRNRHGVVTVAQCGQAMHRLRPENMEHSPRPTCPCGECTEDRRVFGCMDPHRCACAAERLLGRLQPKWNPAQTYHADGLTLTPARRRANETARAEKGRVIFDPSVTQAAPLAAVFRVFAKPVVEGEPAAARLPRPFGVCEEEVEVFTDGSCIGNGSAMALAGSGAWFGPGDLRNVGARVPYDIQSNQTAEIYAVILAEQRVPPFAPLHVVSD
ncbi:RNase H, partial [Trametes versicolor FP-101664 SS1]|uniref:RNase H n=1 Tax=Trametes versicolor (strain FP-101664) TaxID=717944 RepID=UPI0004622C90